MKQCSRCHETKPLNEFLKNKSSHSKDGYSYYCRSCESDIHRAAYAKRRNNIPLPRRQYNKKRHVHTHAEYLHGECLKCRNARRWAAFKKYRRPIICKSGREVPQASFAEG